MKQSIKTIAVAAAFAASGLALPAFADINIGISLSSTGPAAALGIPERNTVTILPDTIAGEKVNYIVLDDATDSTQAGRNARKLVAEEKVDVLWGSSSQPTSAAMAEVADEAETAVITLAPLEFPAEKNKWVFRAPQNFGVMADAIIEHMQANGVKTLGFIGYADAYGESWLSELNRSLEGTDIELSGLERFNRTDTSVTGQAVKLVAANPDAILIVASGTPSAMPQAALLDRGYKGQIYQTHGTATKEYIRVGGDAVEGTVLPVGPIIVADQLPDSHPSKAPGLEYTRLYEDKFGKGSLSAFGAHLYDAYLLTAAAIPKALEKAKPGTAEFRQALRDALEATNELPATHGVFTMSPDDHFGHDERARVLITVKDGDWQLIELDN
ncbi:MAG TPA: ABC transporter substrate-binding protein [Burkholderiaceae bacterium]|nr:ABC transporter substrate-binding protein [Burkholderiaceae bacterium]